MDSLAAALFAEGIETELKCAARMLKELDVSDARPLPASEMYRTSSIAGQPFDKEAVQASKNFKPKVGFAERKFEVIELFGTPKEEGPFEFSHLN